MFSGFIKRVPALDTQISQIVKKSTLATNKLLELQTQALADSSQGITVEQQTSLTTIDEALQKVAAQLHTARIENGSLTFAVSKQEEEIKTLDSRSDALKK